MTWVDDANASLLTDLYELTMAASYHSRGMDGEATFDLFVRTLPPRRNFLIACGLEQALRYLERLRFEADAIEYLASLSMFDDDFLAYLRDFRFGGEVWAVPEGDLVFPPEPLMRITGSLIETQILETFLINCVGFQTMIASKAARVALACGDKTFVDFSPRRDHGADAALKAARASYVGGAAATSNVLAAKEFGLTPTGTMAHSYVMAFEKETDAFRAFAEDFPDNAVLLIDTFDIEEGARRAVKVAEEVAERGGPRLAGVRIDSGDLAEESRSVRKILDEAGLTDTRIILSGDLDEYKIRELVADGIPADSFGVGTQLGTSGDSPTLGGVYKLVDDASGAKIKLSMGKVTLPGRKQVFRTYEAERCVYDTIALEEETDAMDGRPVLAKVMEGGRRLGEPEPLDRARLRCGQALASLPERLRSLERAAPGYEVRTSPKLTGLVAEMKRRTY